MAHRSDASPVRFTPNLNPGSGIFREELRTFSPRTLRHVSRPSGRRHKHLPPARRSIASAAPCRRLHRKTPDASHRIGHFPEFYASSPARPLRCRPRRRHLRRLRLYLHPLTGPRPAYRRCRGPSLAGWQSRTRESWSRPRRVVANAGWMPDRSAAAANPASSSPRCHVYASFVRMAAAIKARPANRTVSLNFPYDLKSDLPAPVFMLQAAGIKLTSAIDLVWLHRAQSRSSRNRAGSFKPIFGEPPQCEFKPVSASGGTMPTISYTGFGFRSDPRVIGCDAGFEPETFRL